MAQDDLRRRHHHVLLDNHRRRGAAAAHVGKGQGDHLLAARLRRCVGTRKGDGAHHLLHPRRAGAVLVERHGEAGIARLPQQADRDAADADEAAGRVAGAERHGAARVEPQPSRRVEATRGGDAQERVGAVVVGNGGVAPGIDEQGLAGGRREAVAIEVVHRRGGIPMRAGRIHDGVDALPVQGADLRCREGDAHGLQAVVLGREAGGQQGGVEGGGDQDGVVGLERDAVDAGQGLSREVEGGAAQDELVPMGGCRGAAVEGRDPGKARLVEHDGVVLARAADGGDAGKEGRQGEIEGAAVEQVQGVVAGGALQGRAGQVVGAHCEGRVGKGRQERPGRGIGACRLRGHRNSLLQHTAPRTLPESGGWRSRRAGPPAAGMGQRPRLASAASPVSRRGEVGSPIH